MIGLPIADCRLPIEDQRVTQIGRNRKSEMKKAPRQTTRDFKSV